MDKSNGGGSQSVRQTTGVDHRRRSVEARSHTMLNIVGNGHNHASGCARSPHRPRSSCTSSGSLFRVGEAHALLQITGQEIDGLRDLALAVEASAQAGHNQVGSGDRSKYFKSFHIFANKICPRFASKGGC